MMQPTRYRWDVYGPFKSPTQWRDLKPGSIIPVRACNALREPHERIRIEYDNGQSVIVRLGGRQK